MNKTLFPILFFTTMIFALFSYIPEVNADYDYFITILSSPYGYTTPVAGLHHLVGVMNGTNLSVYAYAYSDYHFAGWRVDGVFYPTIPNPLVIVLSTGSGNKTIEPCFTPEPQAYLHIFSSVNGLWLNVNGLNWLEGSNITISKNTVVTVSFDVDNSITWDFQRFLINGSVNIYNNSYTFIINGNTSIQLFVIAITHPTPSPLVLMIVSYTVPSMIFFALGGAFYYVGDKVEHGTAGFMIGGAIGLTIMAVSGLLSMAIYALIVMLGILGTYLWIRGGGG